MTDLIQYLDTITNAQSLEELWQQHCDKMATYGFDRLIYGYTRQRTNKSLGDIEDMVILTNQPPEYMNQFLDAGLYDDAPMVNWALENAGACSWSWIQDRIEQGAFSQAEMDVIEFNQKMKTTGGYTVSLKSVSARSKGAIALTARQDVSQEAIDQVWHRHGTDLIVMNNVLHLKILTLPHVGGRPLTSRQREVLEWVGDGKTTQDIATILGRTSATVEKHLRLARDALGVETTAQAVLKAAFQNQMYALDRAG